MSSKKNRIILLIIIIVIVLLLVVIYSKFSNKNLEENTVQYSKEDTLVFPGTSNQESVPNDGTDSYENSEIETEYERYLNSGLVSEFLSIDFIELNKDDSTMSEYLTKLKKYYDENDTKALLNNLDKDFVDKNLIDESKVKQIYSNNIFVSGYEISSIKFWGVNDTLSVVTFTNNNTGDSKYVGINTKQYDNKLYFEVYTEDYFRECGFSINGNNEVVKLDEQKIKDILNNVQENEYNSIDI